MAQTAQDWRRKTVIADIVTHHVDEVNYILEQMRNIIDDAEADVVNMREARRIAREKEIAEAEYVHYDKKLTAAQERVTRLGRNMNKVLTKTGV